ncbi:MAG: hypothetical protein JWO90_454 [Solirubrobacterales bacterium]|jgi:hypothetical protein|nr:hypothetical protein [Solirubrobacterales bacterium]
MPYDLKKLMASAAAIGALGFGGSAIAGAATNNDKTPTAVEQSAEQPGAEAAEAPGTEADDGAEESEAKVSAADRTKAGDAALAAIGSGKVTEVAAETPDADPAADAPEKGDKPDPAYASRTAYDVEVTTADGSAVDVSLDKSFDVLGTQAAEQDRGGDSGQDRGADSEQGEQPDAAEVAPAK